MANIVKQNIDCTPSIHNNRLLRKLGKAESFYWLLDQESCTNFVILAELETRIDQTRFCLALSIVFESNPLLKSRIALGRDGKVYYERSNNSNNGFEMRMGGHEAWYQEMENQLTAQFDIGSYPLMRCIYFQSYDEKQHTILFVFHHALTDAVSAAFLSQEIIKIATSTEQPEFLSPNLLPAQEELYSRRYKKLSSQFRWIWIQLLEMTQRLKLGISPQIPGYKKTNPRKIKMISVKLGVQESSELLKKCQIEGTTVHGALGAAQLLAIRKLYDKYGSIKLSILSPVNMRNKLIRSVNKTDLGMYISFIVNTHRVSDKHLFWDLAKVFKEQLETKTKRGTAHLLWDKFPGSWLFPLTIKGAKRLLRFLNLYLPPVTVISNIGKIDKSNRQIPIRSLQFAMAPQDGCFLCTAVSTYNGNISLNFSYNIESNNHSVAEQISNEMVNLLLKSVDL